ncbi:MAG: 50S ribosomal protein L15 [Actinobacteria bacterium]|nr:50S ribosomal protein L15 [Actinomycetota bacterium]
MRVHELSPARGSRQARRRVGRGIGGKGGKTAGRGVKGQKARDTMKPGFEGGQLPLTQRVPKLRGFSNPFRVEYHVVNVGTLAGFDGDSATPETLAAAGLVHRGGLVKILGHGEINRPIRVHAHGFSATARRAIEASGGSCELLPLPFAVRPPARGSAHTNR